MRKKYLSALLFGALLFASTGTFTSCKDYDDDIKNLQEQLDKKASLEELQKQIDAMQSDVNAAMTAAEEAKTKAQEALDKANSAGGGGVSSEQLEDLKDEIQAQIDKLASLEDVKAEIDALKAEIANTYATQDALDALTLKVNTLSEKVTAIVGNLLNGLVYQPSLYINGIEATEYPWMSYIPLKGVTNPNVTFMDDENTVCVITTPSTEWNFANQTVAKSYDPIVWVDYHVNPSKAKIAKGDLSIISNDAEVVTTRSSVALPKLDANEDIKLQNGILSIPLRADGSAILTQPTNNNSTDVADLTKASIFALQANVKTDQGEDRVVTSDYAALYASEITPKAIAYSVSDYNGFDIEAKDCAYSTPKDELWPTVEEAIKNVPTLRVAYDSEIDLSDVLAIHYNHASHTSKNGTHKVWNWGEEKDYGLKYEFSLIQYKAGNNSTSDSKYVDQNQIANGIVAPRMVTADGNTSTSTGISSVGRHPLVQVRVVDQDGAVVLHAYIKVEIVQTIENIVTNVFNKGEQKFCCDGSTPELTWSEVSELLIEKVDYSKEEFLALYEVDDAPTAEPNYAAGELYQYEKVGNKFVKVSTASGKYGEVTERPDAQGTTNPVLVWDLSMDDQQRIYDLTGHEKTIYVRYIRKTTNPAGTETIAPVYMPIKVNVAKPQGTVVKKIAEYWYNNSTNTRLNVPYPVDGGNSLNYEVDLNQVWEGNKPVFGMGTTFASYTDAILANQTDMTGVGGYKYYFTAGNNMTSATLEDLFGNTYKLFAGRVGSPVPVSKVSDIFGVRYDVDTNNALQHALKSDNGEYTNNALYAEVVTKEENTTLISVGQKIMIAQIDQATGKITYANNEVSKRLLNAYDHSDAKLFAEIGICAFSPCDVALSLNGAEYPAYFLRPISIKDNNTGEFVDAQANGSVINIADVFDFEDWRDEKFKDGNDYSNVWLYAFYGLKNVEVKTNLITTDLNGYDLNTKLLSDVTNLIKITQPTPTSVNLTAYNSQVQGTLATWNAIVAELGEIKYENNGNNVGSFNLRIPVDFTYDWGTIRAYVVCKVKSTMGN